MFYKQTLRDVFLNSIIFGEVYYLLSILENQKLFRNFFLCGRFSFDFWLFVLLNKNFETILCSHIDLECFPQPFLANDRDYCSWVHFVKEIIKLIKALSMIERNGFQKELGNYLFARFLLVHPDPADRCGAINFFYVLSRPLKFVVLLFDSWESQRLNNCIFVW